MSPRLPISTLLLLVAAGCAEEPRAAADVTVKGGAPIRATPPSPPPREPPAPEPVPAREPEPDDGVAVAEPSAPPAVQPDPEPEVAPEAVEEAVEEAVAEAVEEAVAEAVEEAVAVVPESEAAPEPAAPSPFDVDKASEILTDISLEGDFPLEGFSVIDRKPSGPAPKGVEYVSWQDLSLRELYGRQLRAILSPEDIGETEAADFPERIRAYDGKKIALLGFMVPLEWDGDEVPELMLVRDLMSCCFGGVPMPDEWMHVRMVGKARAEYYPYVPVLVTGTLRLGGFEDQAGYTVGCYRLEAVSLVEEAGW
jgi:hypothetical protein